MPDMFWRGWADACAWLDAALATEFGAVGQGTPHQLGCSLPLEAGVQVQVAWLGPFSVLVGERQFVRPLTIAGQQARAVRLPRSRPALAWSRRLEVATGVLLVVAGFVVVGIRGRIQGSASRILAPIR